MTHFEARGERRGGVGGEERMREEESVNKKTNENGERLTVEQR